MDVSPERIVHFKRQPCLTSAVPETRARATMDRRNFLKVSAAGAYGACTVVHAPWATAAVDQRPWFDKPMRWAQLVLVENDPGQFDPDFWLDYFKRVHADGACLSAGGVVAYYPTDVPMHHRSRWLGDSDPLGYLINGCRNMGMAVIARTDPHAAWPEVYKAYPDRIAVDASGSKRRHWANPELWVTCALGPQNFDFMTEVHREIMSRYQVDGSSRIDGPAMDSVTASTALRTSGRSVASNCREQRTIRMKRMQRIAHGASLGSENFGLLWDRVIRDVKPTSRYIPNGFPDKVEVGRLSDIFFTDHQARRGVVPPWSNGRGAKILRATMGMKPIGGIFSVGVEEQYRWKDSVQSDAEIRIWVADGIANGYRPWFVKFSGTIYDRRWLNTVEQIYQWHHGAERYLRNVAPLARVAMVYSEHPGRAYGRERWQERWQDHGSGMYHALIEARVPFEMVNDRLLDADHLKPFKLLILPNVATLSDAQCQQLRQFVDGGGNLLATFESSLYDETGKRRQDFGLADLFGVSFDGHVEGPMKNSYLRLAGEGVADQFRAST